MCFDFCLKERKKDGGVLPFRLKHAEIIRAEIVALHYYLLTWMYGILVDLKIICKPNSGQAVYLVRVNQTFRTWCMKLLRQILYGLSLYGLSLYNRSLQDLRWPQAFLIFLVFALVAMMVQSDVSDQ